MIEQYLRRYGWQRFESREEPDEKEGVVLTGWKGLGDSQHMMVIDPIVEKNVLVFHVPKVLSAPLDTTPSDCLRELLVALGNINYQILVGKFGYDPRDGEVRFTVVVPTDNINLTYEQFEHCMRVITMTVERYGPSLQEIANGSKTHQDLDSSSDLMGALRRMIEGLGRD
ncbi:MAG: YbjN domain-containing protein [Chloroflexia bacterium]